MSTKANVLILGAGYVTKPIVQYLSDQGYGVTVGSRGLAKAQKLIEGIKNTAAVQIDVEKAGDCEKLDKMLGEKTFSAVVSLLPYIHHVIVAKMAIKYKVHFFTTSYVSDAMKALGPEGKAAGIIMINECGVDPGTDHMSAMRVIDSVTKQGGKVTSFTSYCGGLPAPKDNNNPLGYKFSWAPRGVLLASRNSALFLKDGKNVTIEGKDLFDNYNVETVGDMGEYEMYPNRDSTKYIDIYGIKDCKTMIRGTYRNKGWCSIVKKFADMGYLSLEKTKTDMTYGQLTAQLVLGDATKDADAIIAKLGFAKDSHIYKAMEWLDLFSDVKVPASVDTPLDALCHVMLEKMKYAGDEVDMLLMKHTFVAEFPDKNERHTITSMLVDYGIKNGDSSMSRTVSLPVAIAVRMVLEGTIKLTGLQIPIIPELYNPILNELETLNIKFVEKTEKVEKM